MSHASHVCGVCAREVWEFLHGRHVRAEGTRSACPECVGTSRRRRRRVSHYDRAGADVGASRRRRRRVPKARALLPPIQSQGLPGCMRAGMARTAGTPSACTVPPGTRCITPGSRHWCFAGIVLGNTSGRWRWTIKAGSEGTCVLSRSPHAEEVRGGADMAPAQGQQKFVCAVLQALE